MIYQWGVVFRKYRLLNINHLLVLTLLSIGAMKRCAGKGFEIGWIFVITALHITRKYFQLKAHKRTPYTVDL